MSVPTGDVQATFAATLVDEWVAAGLRHAVVCPGSRSTPLALALAGRGEIDLHVRLDERGACFFAIGLGLATGTPAVVCTTSGTAAAELHAGVVEASHARVPLIVCTADRPPRLHHVGAPQTIEQVGLYGSAPRRSFDPGVPRDADRGWWRRLGAASYRAALEGAGPVHLNLAFEEPLVGSAAALPSPPLPSPATGSRPVPAPAAGGWWRRRGLILAGAGAPLATLEVAERLGWPVLADPISGLRLRRPGVVGAADAVLRDRAARAALVPEVVLVVGRPWASRVVAEFVESSGRAGAEVVAVGEVLDDPARVVGRFHRADPEAFFDRLDPAWAGRDDRWRDRWERAEALAQRAIDETLLADPVARGGRATEPGVARHLFGTLERPSVVFVSSSMPVRDLEWFGAPRPDPPRVVANRGANGIDGVTSSALGLAAGQDGPVVCLLGDLAFLHDASALAALGARRGSCTLVVLDNGGGGIFSFLPQADTLSEERFEQVFGTAPSVSVGAVGRGFSLPVAEVATLGELDTALARFVGVEPCALVVVAVPDRAQNRALHDRLHAAVAGALAAGLPR